MLGTVLAFFAGNMVGKITKIFMAIQMGLALKKSERIDVRAAFDKYKEEGIIPSDVGFYTIDDLDNMRKSLEEKRNDDATISENTAIVKKLIFLKKFRKAVVKSGAMAWHPAAREMHGVLGRALCDNTSKNLRECNFEEKFVITGILPYEEILGHEVGHIIDFEESHPKKRSRIEIESAAWDKSPVRTEYHDVLKKSAIANYRMKYVPIILAVSFASLAWFLG